MARCGGAAGPRGEPAEGRGRVQGSWMSCAAGVWTPLHLPARHRTRECSKKAPRYHGTRPHPPPHPTSTENTATNAVQAREWY